MTTEPLTIGMLEDWAGAGAHWRVIHVEQRRAVVELQRCTGEPVERLESEDPQLLESRSMPGRYRRVNAADGCSPIPRLALVVARQLARAEASTAFHRSARKRR